jgi:hypothetical protein
LQAPALANKQYISIIRLFRHCDISLESDFNLARTRKQLQAEFGIAQSGFIEVDGYSYARHEVFEEIERPDFLERLEFHKQVWDNPAMLGLLENYQVDPLVINEAFAPFTGNAGFDEFFSPYFVGPFNYLCRTYLTENRLRDTGDLLAFEDFLQPAEREEAFRPLRAYLEETLRLFRNTSEDNYSMMRPKLVHWVEQDWYQFLNNLPHEFYEEKTDITTFLINIGVGIQKKHKRDCQAISEQLVSVQDLPENLRSLILSNHAAYTGSSGSSGGWGSFWWVGWVIFMLVRILASDGCKSTPKYNNSQFQIITETNMRNDSSIQRLIDSLKVQNGDSFRYKFK